MWLNCKVIKKVGTLPPISTSTISTSTLPPQMTQFFEGPTPSSSPATPPLIKGWGWGGSNYARDERTLLMQSAPDIELDVFDRNPLNFIILWHFPMKLQKKELIQEEDWPDCSNTQVGMQKRLSNHQGPPTGLSACQEDTTWEIQKPIPCYGRIWRADQGLANHAKWQFWRIPKIL